MYQDFTQQIFSTDLPSFSKFAETLNILIQQSHLIAKLFDTQCLNIQGIYYVKICQDGIWRFILIDDFVPFGNRKLITSAEISIQFWPILLMKSLAKIYETYQNLSTLDVDELLYDLTGAPRQKLKQKELPYRWNELKRALDKKNILLAFFNSEDKLLQDLITIFYGQHKSLQIQQVFEFSMNGKPTKVVQMRLPGEKKNGFVWKGKFNKNSIQWCMAMNYIANVEARQNEFLLLCFESEFLNIFEWVDIFRIEEDHMYQAMQTNVIKNSYSIRTFDLKYSAKCFLGCVQQSQRYQRKMNLEKYGECIIFLCRKNVDDTFSFIQAIRQYERNTSMELYLQPGNYLIFFWLSSESQMKKRICFYYQGDQEISLERVSGKQNQGILFGILSGIRKNRICGPQSEISFQIEESMEDGILMRRLDFRSAKLIFIYLMNTGNQEQNYQLYLPENTIQIKFRQEIQSSQILKKGVILMREQEKLMFLFKQY